jgi:hypothetical protein
VLKTIHYIKQAHQGIHNNWRQGVVWSNEWLFTCERSRFQKLLVIIIKKIYKLNGPQNWWQFMPKHILIWISWLLATKVLCNVIHIKDLHRGKWDKFWSNVTNKYNTQLCVLGDVGDRARFHMDWDEVYNVCFPTSSINDKLMWLVELMNIH